MFDDIFKKFVKSFDGSIDDIMKDFDKYFDEAIKASGWQPRDINDMRKLQTAKSRVKANAHNGKYKTQSDLDKIKKEKQEAKRRKKQDPNNPYKDGRTIFDEPIETEAEEAERLLREAQEKANHTNFYDQYDPNNPNRFNRFDPRNLDNSGYDINGNKVEGSYKGIRDADDLSRISYDRGGSISDVFDQFKEMSFLDKVTTIGNVAFAVSDYKDARRQGHGVISSAMRAGTQFAIGELMGIYTPLFYLAKDAPGMIVKGTEMLYRENRKMNSAANNQVFGGAQFQDTQQLATMRQSGMEMAKMAQYNLQQTLMGQEASFLHR